ncbi:acyl-CoA dehydrogenase family protein [Pseudomonas chlororaphis]|uniref:acyl-CoA dehydrogenase family protein n=1 Tax=Pseudomonas chlororaphis TaxID=587753 RepID=UPI001B30A93D|nr:acyl-CoA dehydrogenase family protein [Pseudomonas chlororaphis]MBP5058838.1 acyl-CoA dehydrogenase family protein [Pseudomonas chlororaphis]MBP5142956.1 acyl-CoA dehydrogenase family protein [Pseudomonas chlororaphis]QTT98280.1 acyl-CoA dehydrogenase family protein [Pseudomonas chlororaphis]
MNSTFAPLPLAAIPAEEEALRAPIREFLQDTLRDIPMDRLARGISEADCAFSRKLAEKGLIGLALPKAVGGAGRTCFARFVLVEELLVAGAPASAHWANDRQTAPLLLRFASPEQQAKYVPRLLSCDALFCIGMSEPDTGSDLAGVRCRAVPTGDGRWRLNGRKIWTSNAHHAHYMCALVRTSGTTEDRHKGLSQVIVDLSLPGVSIRPIKDLADDTHFCEVLFEDVLLPEDALIGEEGSGFLQVGSELSYERSGPDRIYSAMVLIEGWLRELREVPNPGPAVTSLLGRMAGRLAVLRAMSIALAAKLEMGEQVDLQASLLKDLGTEFEQAVPGWISEALELTPDHPPSAVLRQTLAYITQICPSFSLRGGTRQILRSIIARGLGLR